MTAAGVIVVGAGQRGRHVYGRWATENHRDLRVVGVVDPDPERLVAMAAEHPGAATATAIADLDAQATGADAVIVATPDRTHHEVGRWAIGTGLHVLLEKPVAATLQQAEDLIALAGRSPATVHVAHVLRYTPFFQTVHEVVRSGRLGDIVTVSHRENVAAFHMAHSFVRGNWSRSEDSTPMIVQKCCHDFDILVWNLDDPVVRLASIGSLRHFQASEAPDGATERCTDGCPADDCPFDARHIYLDPAHTGWPVHVITDDLTEAGRLRALAAGPYGRCVYRAGSTVVDHQVVTMETASGTSVTLTMHGHSDREQRTMRYDGTRATLRAATGPKPRITIGDHRTGTATEIDVRSPTGGHGGGDDGIMTSFVRSIRTGEPGMTDASTALTSHRLAFQAEVARLSGSWVTLD